ncbi:serine-rich adhesin for platelets-like [Watersipora subatra]|uniref:serine-rich adhesin for platelets-like n=1 Tax=Watersipora subatra TaxID=2589382 RepID=UPI00355C7154
MGYSVRSKLEKTSAHGNAADAFAFSETTEGSSLSTNSKRHKKKEYTVQEDILIINAVLKRCRDLSINGNRLWEVIAANKDVNRTSQSLKERFIKKILPYAEKYDISAEEFRKLRKLGAAKAERVLAGTRRLHTREQLSFLRAPSTATPAVFNPSDSSSSEDGSFAAKVLVPQVPLARKRKPTVIELSSTSGPSSQSEASQQSQEASKNRQSKDRLKHRCTESPSKRKSSRLSKTDKSSPAGSEDRRSYVIEDPSPDVVLCVSPPEVLPSPGLGTRQENIEEADESDLALLVTPRQLTTKPVRVKLTSKLTAEASVSQPTMVSEALLNSNSTVANIGVYNERKSNQATLPPPQASTLKSPATILINSSLEPSPGDNHFSTQAVSTSPLSIEVSAADYALLESSIHSLPRTVEADRATADKSFHLGDIKITDSSCKVSLDTSSAKECRSSQMLRKTEEERINSSQLMDSVAVKPQSSSQLAIVNSSIYIQSANTIQTQSLPITKSDELFRDLLMSDTAPPNHSWLPSTSKESFSNMNEKPNEASSESQYKHSVALPNENAETQLTWSSFDLESQKTNRLSIESAKSTSGNCDSGNSATFTTLSQPDQVQPNSSIERKPRRSPRKSNQSPMHFAPKQTSSSPNRQYIISPETNRSSIKTTKSASVNCDSGSNTTVVTASQSDEVHPDSLIEKQPRRSPRKFNKNPMHFAPKQTPSSTNRQHIISPETHNLMQVSPKSIAKPAPCHSTPNVEPMDFQFSTADSNVDQPNVIIEKTPFEQVPDKTCVCDKLTATPEIKSNLSVVKQPPSTKRQSSLKDVLQLPLRSPQYQDAESSFTSIYTDCHSNHSNVSKDPQDIDSNISTTNELNQIDCAQVTLTSQINIGCSKSNYHDQASSDVKPGVDCYSTIKVETRSTDSLEPVPGTSKEILDVTLQTDSDVPQIGRCTSCPEDKVCRMNELKSHEMYSRLMSTYRLTDEETLMYVLTLSADWELIEQHIKSRGEVGERWTRIDDAHLFNPCFRRKNLKMLKRKFSAREVSARKAFLLRYVDLTARQRRTLLNM